MRQWNLLKDESIEIFSIGHVGLINKTGNEYFNVNRIWTRENLLLKIEFD